MFWYSKTLNHITNYSLKFQIICIFFFYSPNENHDFVLGDTPEWARPKSSDPLPTAESQAVKIMHPTPYVSIAFVITAVCICIGYIIFGILYGYYRHGWSIAQCIYFFCIRYSIIITISIYRICNRTWLVV